MVQILQKLHAQYLTQSSHFTDHFAFVRLEDQRLTYDKVLEASKTSLAPKTTIICQPLIFHPNKPNVFSKVRIFGLILEHLVSEES